MADLDRSTLHEDAGAAADAPRPLRVTLLWHADLARVGESVVLPPRTRSLQLSRGSPDFPNGPPGDPFQSRSPLELRATPQGLVCWPSAADLPFSVDGAPGTPGLTIPEAALARGVRVAVGRRLVVWIDRGERVQRDGDGIHGVSRATDELRGAIARVAPRPDTVLLRGETGTGKDLAARAIHAASHRAKGPFVAVNVAAIPAETAASQLFGHASGAFTGAARSHGGFFADAEGGTLFLDEIGELPDALQPLLLRALDAGEVQPVGGRPRKVDVRVITATDADLERLVAERRFRPALLHRLAIHTLHLAPLRERPADIAVQAAAFCAREGVALSHRALLALLDHPWPGNSRELRAWVSRLAVDGEERALEALTSAAASRDPSPQPSRLVTPELVASALAQHGYAVDATAAALGVAKNTLYAHMTAAGIPRGQDLDAAVVRGALAEASGDVDVAAAALRVSGRALRLRMRALGVEG